ncbi:MAG TPA: DUF3137 domain-containing protein, partial [Terriglobia bacterium]|nr:DUF3137 domain-containing protein [Terriglobia bacterium]
MPYFKSIFGPTRDEIWSALQAQIGAEVVPGGLWQGDRLQAQAGEWTVTLEEHTMASMAGKAPIIIHHTRMRAPFSNPGGFRFSIHRASMFSYVGTLLGMQDIQVGHAEFDAEFVIKGNNEKLVQSLCSSERLRALVTVQPKFQLSIHDDEGWFGKKYPPEVDVLVFDVAEHIRDVERLKGLYDVFAETLHQLSKL